MTKNLAKITSFERNPKRRGGRKGGKGRDTEKRGKESGGRERPMKRGSPRPKWPFFSLRLLNKTPTFTVGVLFTGRGQPLSFYFPSLQKSFYDASYEPLREDHMNKFMFLDTSETSKTSKLSYKENVVMVAANGKILKKRRLSLNQFITDDDLEAIANNTEEGKGSNAIISLFSVFEKMQTAEYRRK